jgi:hypothetical protein
MCADRERKKSAAGYTGFTAVAGQPWRARHRVRRHRRRTGDDVRALRSILFVLAFAGSLAARRTSPVGLGTLRTDTPTFVVFLVGFVIVFALLNSSPRSSSGRWISR